MMRLQRLLKRRHLPGMASGAPRRNIVILLVYLLIVLLGVALALAVM
jgi:hypothetical protein